MTEAPAAPPVVIPGAEPTGERCADSDLWNRVEGCDGMVVDNFYGGGGVKCTKCPGWFCY